MPEKAKPVDPLILRGQEWRHRLDPDCGLKNAGLWVARIDHDKTSHKAATKNGNVQFRGARSPSPQDLYEAELMIAYIERLADSLGAALVAEQERTGAVA